MRAPVSRLSVLLQSGIIVLVACCIPGFVSAQVVLNDADQKAQHDSGPSRPHQLGSHRELQSDDDGRYWQALSLPGGHDTLTEAADGTIRFVTLRLYQDPAPLQPLPMRPAAPTAGTTSADSIASIFRGGSRQDSLSVAGLRRRSSRRISRPVSDVISGKESKARSTSDAGSLISKSSRNRGVVGQKRSPIITDPRVRGSRVGQLAASGSHWVPARVDLDTVLSKLDADLISSIDVVKGPYAVRYGPGVGFLAFELQGSPRSDDGPVSGGSSTLEYQTNGERWYGRQTLSHADEDWGIRVGYGHRTGTDYESGNGTDIPSGFQSRNLDVTYGLDISARQSLEFAYLHQNQTDVELPGQAFDINSLRTDAFEATWLNQDVTWSDGLEIEAWFHDTQLQGDANRPAKRRTFPFLEQIDYSGTTNVLSMSTGVSAQAVWELNPDRELSTGVDLRVVRQELNEISSGQIGFALFNDANSPIPRSASVNPGLFLELVDTSIEKLILTSGVRTDVITTEVLADANRLNNLGTGTMGLSLAQILGTGDFDQSFGLWSGFVSAEYAVDDQWTISAAAGHGQRAPSLTEMYAAESFMFLLQSGLNSITGDPRLDMERRWQIDLGSSYETDNFRAGVTGYHAWIDDRITFEALSTRNGPPFNQTEQVNLKYVNTDRATMYGFEADAEYDLNRSLSVFGSLSYVQGTDQTRNGSFATRQADGALGAPSQRIPGLNRGFFADDASTAAAPMPNQEPLPGIPPLESRLGVRVNGAVSEMQWSLELAARIVDDQSRVATELFENQTPGFTVLDLRGYLQVNPQMSVYAGIENLTDKNYREHFDFRNLTGTSIQQPGINAYFGTQLVY